ncbi:MAG: copper chaperone PCu(A)C [Alphaproteobacteria bacterium]
MRISTVLVSGLVALGLAACGAEETEPATTDAAPETEVLQESPESAPESAPASSSESEAESPAHTLVVLNAWARLNPIPGRPAAVYFTASSPVDDELVGVSTSVAERAELHTHEHADGMMRMMKVESFPMTAEGPLEFVPGGHHVMLFGVSEGLADASSFPLTLEFKNAGAIEVLVNVGEHSP